MQRIRSAIIPMLILAALALVFTVAIQAPGVAGLDAESTTLTAIIESPDSGVFDQGLRAAVEYDLELTSTFNAINISTFTDTPSTASYADREGRYADRTILGSVSGLILTMTDPASSSPVSIGWREQHRIGSTGLS